MNFIVLLMLILFVRPYMYIVSHIWKGISNAKCNDLKPLWLLVDDTVLIVIKV